MVRRRHTPAVASRRGVKRLREEVRVRGHRAAKSAEPATSATFANALAIGATSVADVEKLVEELLNRTRLPAIRGRTRAPSECPLWPHGKIRVGLGQDHHESLGKWRSLGAVDQAPVMMPRTPTLSPIRDGGSSARRTISCTTGSQTAH